MENNNKEALKAIILKKINKLTRKIKVIESMLDDIQYNEYHLHFCYKGEVAFAGEDERIEHDLLSGYEKYVIGRLKHRLHEEQKRLNFYNKMLIENTKNKK
jgi:hypothetical protein